MKMTSSAFQNGAVIPKSYTMDGENRNPPLHFEEVPAQARSLALIVDDPDAPGGTFNHWLLYNLDAKVHDIKENSVPVMAIQGRNDFGVTEYSGPKPPSGEHRYFFKLYALDMVLDLPRGAKRADLDKAIEKHVLAEATLMGRYRRN